MICDNITVGQNGHLYFAGQDTVELAKQYGTPLYLMDEDKIRESCRVYTEAFKKHFGENARPPTQTIPCHFEPPKFNTIIISLTSFKY